MTPDKIRGYVRDAVALGLGSWGFIHETLKEQPEALLLILFFAMVLVPMPFALWAMRTHEVQAAPPTPEPPSGSPPAQPQPSSPSTS